MILKAAYDFKAVEHRQMKVRQDEIRHILKGYAERIETISRDYGATLEVVAQHRLEHGCNSRIVLDDHDGVALFQGGNLTHRLTSPLLLAASLLTFWLRSALTELLSARIGSSALLAKSEYLIQRIFVLVNVAYIANCNAIFVMAFIEQPQVLQAYNIQVEVCQREPSLWSSRNHV
jgi:hypothetical protein